MKVTMVLTLFVFLISVALSPSKANTTDWANLSRENVKQLTIADELSLTQDIIEKQIEAIYLIPNSSTLFIHWNNNDTSQSGWLLWDILNGESTFDMQTERLSHVTFSESGHFMVITTRHPDVSELTDTCLWSLVSLEKLNCWATYLVASTTFSQDETVFIVSTSENMSIGWNTQENRQLFTIPTGIIMNTIYSSDTGYVAFDSIDSISVWDITNENPLEVHRYDLSNRTTIGKVTFDITGRYIFFMTISVMGSGGREFAIWDTIHDNITFTGREIFRDYLPLKNYGRLFLFTQPDSRVITEIRDPLTNVSYGTINPFTINDYTLAQDIFIAREMSDAGLSWSVKNFETQETLFTLYENADNPLMDVRFTQDERFIIAYTQDGLVQLWGVPAEG
jgi:hypothetical protein